MRECGVWKRECVGERKNGFRERMGWERGMREIIG